MILAIDQGTTGTTCLVVDELLRPVGRGYREIRQHFPEPGWVEHDPEEIWASVLTTAEQALADARISASDLTALGITNQRETTVVWERRTGRPVHRAIVWQDRRTAARCAELPADLVRERTGLVCDPYFSASKLEWILARTGLPQRQLAFGTIDAWLAWKLTGGTAHVTDVTNASRTMLLSLATGDWDDELLALFSVDRAVLPAVVPSARVVAEASLLGASVPLAGIAGDQQAALFGQGCFSPGEAKVTYGTGTFVLVNVGDDARPPQAGMLKSVAATGPGTARQFAAEGSVLVGAAALQWLRDGLGLIGSAAETERLALEVESTEGVYFVPALTGLGAPHWDPGARGLVCGLTRGTTRAHLVRAALEAIAHQVVDVLDVLPVGAEVLRADGGATANRFLMQFQADLAGTPVEVAADAEATALGAAALAGLAAGTWPDAATVQGLLRRGERYEPSWDDSARARHRAGWAEALAADGVSMTSVIAHRGASAEEKENTLPAFERAVELGADYVEFDVQASSDGGLVVFHDLRLDRLTPLRGPLRARPLAELRELGIPTLEEVLELTSGRIGVMAELKSPWLHRRHDVVGRTVSLLGPDAVVVSFSRRAILETRRLRPELRTVQHVGYGTSIRVAAGFAWAAGFDDTRVTRRGLAKARALGLETAVYTVNEEARLLELARLGVGGIFTDCPGRALAALGRRPGG